MTRVDSTGYSERSLWEKLARSARMAGREVAEKALCLFYAAREPSTPQWAKSVIYGALAYLILPADAIPDLTPGIGFTDDLSALAFAVATTAAHVTPAIKEKARRQATAWFGE
jgi:uncharacterized membrane protein YkvA (DUF1232 family)